MPRSEAFIRPPKRVARRRIFTLLRGDAASLPLAGDARTRAVVLGFFFWHRPANNTVRKVSTYTASGRSDAPAMSAAGPVSFRPAVNMTKENGTERITVIELGEIRSAPDSRARTAYRGMWMR